MKVDWFIADLGIANIEEMPENALELLSERADGFLRGGGVLSWAEWKGLADETRAALSEAGDRIRNETAGKIGAAVNSRAVVKALMTGADPTDVAVREWLKKAADQIEAKVRK